MAEPLQNKKTLLLITNHFPFGKGESFIESELPYLTEKFSRTIILSRNVIDPQTREVPGVANVYRLNPVSGTADYLLLPFLFLFNLRRSIRFFRLELKTIHRTKKYYKANVRQAIHDLCKSLLINRKIASIIRKEKIKGPLTLYSYWMNAAAVATLFINYKHSLKRICRAHGGDVFAFRQPLNYLSFRTTLIQNLDRVFSISNAGADELKKYVDSSWYGKISVCYLGTKRQQPRDIKQSTPFLIVSCAFMVNVKRIFILTQAVKHLTMPVRWVHIGDGPMRADLEEDAIQNFKGKSNISFEFTGAMSNAQTLDFYRNNDVHVFVNTSFSEGIPVSIMEAQSFGIPVVASRVGGIPEIVNCDNGILFAADSYPEHIAYDIKRVLNQDPKAYAKMRQEAFRNWEQRFNAELNFSTFTDQILALHDT